MTINIYETTTSEVVKFKANGDKKMRTAKIRYDNEGMAYFKGFGGIKIWFSDIVNNNSDWGDKTALANGIIGQCNT